MTVNSTAVSADQKLSKRVIVSYAIPRFGSAMMFLMIGVYLPKFYTDTLLLAPAFIAWTYLIGRFWDGFTDPVMGYISDQTKLKMGRRRPYFLLSAIPVAIAFFFLWSPPDTLKDWGLFGYLTATYLLTFTFWTIFSIPHNSLGAELTMDYHERTVLTGVREAIGIFGTFIGTLAPPLFAYMLGSRQTGFSYLAATIGIITTCAIFFCFFNVRENPEFQKQQPIAIKDGLKILFKNQPFRALVAVFVFSLIGNSFVPILTLYIADYVVKMPKIGTYIIATYLLASVFSIYLWTRLSGRIGKKETWAYGFILSSTVFTLSIYLHEGTWISWLIMATFAGFGNSCTIALAPSMMADVIDLDELNTARRREGAYFGIWSLIDKTAIAITTFMGLQALDVMGYVPNQEQSLRVFWTLKFLYSVIPGVFFCVAYFLLRRYPITQAEHKRIRAEIEAKKVTHEAVDLTRNT